MRKYAPGALLLVSILLVQSFLGTAQAKNDSSLLSEPNCKKFKVWPLIDTTFTQAYKHHGTVYVDIYAYCPGELENEIGVYADMWTQEEFPITDSRGNTIFVCRRRDHGEWMQDPNPNNNSPMIPNCFFPENILPANGKIYVSAHFFGNEETARSFQTPINLKKPIKIEDWGGKKLISVKSKMPVIPKKVIDQTWAIELQGAGKLFENDVYIWKGRDGNSNGESYTDCYVDNPKHYCVVDFSIATWEGQSNYFFASADSSDHPKSEKYFKNMSIGNHIIYLTYTNHSGKSYPLKVPFKIVKTEPKRGSERIDFNWNKDSKPWDVSPCGSVTNNLNIKLEHSVKISLQVSNTRNGPWTTVTSTKSNYDFCFKEGSIKPKTGYYRVVATNLKSTSSQYYYYKYVPPCRPNYELVRLWKTYLRIDKSDLKYWKDVLDDDRQALIDASGDLLGMAEAQSQYNSDNINYRKAEREVAKDEAKISRYSCN